MFDFYKTFEANQKIARDVATQITVAAAEFTKTVVEANAQLVETYKAQAAEAAEAFKAIDATKFAGFDAYTPKSLKKTAKASQD